MARNAGLPKSTVSTKPAIGSIDTLASTSVLRVRLRLLCLLLDLVALTNQLQVVGVCLGVDLGEVFARQEVGEVHRPLLEVAILEDVCVCGREDAVA